MWDFIVYYAVYLSVIFIQNTWYYILFYIIPILLVMRGVKWLKRKLYQHTY